MNIKRFIALVSSGVLLTASLLGCVKINTGGNDGGKDSAAESSKYPIETSVELTCWVPLNPNVSSHAQSLGNTEFAKGLEERTGVKVNYIHPTAGVEIEVFSTLVASKQPPDLVDFDWVKWYPGGVDKAIEDGTIYELNSYIDKYAPNLSKYYTENPDISRSMKTDSGSQYVFPFIRGDDLLMTFIGPMVRQDWLDELGMDKPETIDEWEDMLRAFKEKKGAKAPLVLKISSDFLKQTNAIVGGFGVGADFYLQDGKVKFGPMEPEYKNFVSTMAKWYKEGLYDNEFTNTDSKRIGAMVLNGETGVTFGYNGGDFGSWILAGKDKDSKFNLQPVAYPKAAKNQKPEFAQKDMPATGLGVAIMSSCENPEIAARFLDYGYSREGHLYYNFGQEGISYEMQNGVPTFTDMITDKAKNGGFSVSQALTKYARSSYNGPFVQDKNYLAQTYVTDAQKSALTVWSDNNMDEHNLPLISFTADESKEISRLMQDINTFKTEELYKLVKTGDPSLPNYDSMTDKMKSIGIDLVLEKYQAAYDRYQSRK